MGFQPRGCGFETNCYINSFLLFFVLKIHNTTDFYFTNKLPSNIAIRPQHTNNNSPNADQAEAADPASFEADPLQPGKVCLHSSMLYTPQAPVLDLTGEHIKTKEDTEAAFHYLNLCTHNKQKSDGAKGHKAKQSK